MKRFVSLNGELKLTNMKSHDCHIMMQTFLPIEIRGIIPKNVRHTITSLCSFFNTICSKVLDPSTLDELQNKVIQTLCEFEMYFPPTFFDIMVHLICHLVREIKLCGPVFLRWCYPFERHMGVLQDKLRNPAQPEGSMSQATWVKKLEIWWPTVHPYLVMHKQELANEYPSKGERELTQLHNREFITWFQDKVMGEIEVDGNTVCETVQYLSLSPREVVQSYQGYDVNGYTFWTERQDQKSLSVQNSGVSLVVSSREYASSKDRYPVDAELSYYGRVQDIWERKYGTKLTVGLFWCKWADNNKRCVKRDDPCGFTHVDLGRLRETEEPFILVSQAKQIFYITDPADKKWSIVVPGKRNILGVGDVEDEDEYDAFDDTPPFTNTETEVTNNVDNDTNYMRSDHTEGILVDDKI
ncbi:uncharacterized protein [Spinacia oleracea]|uniref:DUF4218 domain-containing protein n=1 Tax=Spinacia oleracea TaxID=3562 RepID=A0ABM3QX87_SPIOL|nr:uncharacterized protein LOC130463003 [Spinacia oleracea]